MRKNSTWLILLSAVVGAALYFAGKVQGTPPNGFVGTTIAKGRLEQMDAFNQLVDPPFAQDPGNNGNVWLSLQKNERAIGLIRTEQRLATRRKHRLALASWS